MTENVLIVYNPNSGKGRGERLAERLRRQLERRGATVGEVFNSNSLERLAGFCRDNAGNPRGFSLAVIIGGDGTLSPWVDAMIKNNFRVPVYAMGRGTANDFPTFLKTNKRPRRVAKIITSNPVVREMDTLDINGESFGVNVACGGAFTNGVTSYSKGAKRRFGKLAYMTRALFEAFKMRAQQLKFTVDSREYVGEFYLFLILNSPNAGSIRGISKTARPWSGEFEMVAIRKCGFFGKIGLAFSGLFKRLSRSRNVLHVRGKEFLVEVMGEVHKNFALTDIDGNKGGPYPLHVNVSEEKMTFLTRRVN